MQLFVWPHSHGFHLNPPTVELVWRPSWHKQQAELTSQDKVCTGSAQSDREASISISIYFCQAPPQVLAPRHCIDRNLLNERGREYCVELVRSGTTGKWPLEPLYGAGFFRISASKRSLRSPRPKWRGGKNFVVSEFLLHEAPPSLSPRSLATCCERFVDWIGIGESSGLTNQQKARVRLDGCRDLSSRLEPQAQCRGPSAASPLGSSPLGVRLVRARPDSEARNSVTRGSNIWTRGEGGG